MKKHMLAVIVILILTGGGAYSMDNASLKNPTNPRISPIDLSVPTQTKTATFALGCFWGPDTLFGLSPGVVRTRVGYAGGTTENPTYHHIGDHTETVQIDYDPTKTSYRELSDIFWRSHDSHRKTWMRQYMSIIFYHTEEQKRVAMETRDRERAKSNTSVVTEIVAFSRFYLATEPAMLSRESYLVLISVPDQRRDCRRWCVGINITKTRAVFLCPIKITR